MLLTGHRAVVGKLADSPNSEDVVTPVAITKITAYTDNALCPEKTADVNEASCRVILPLNLLPAEETTPPTTTTSESTTAPFRDEKFIRIAYLVGILMFGSFFVLSHRAKELATQENGVNAVREVVELFTIFIIVAAVLILAMVEDLGANTAVSVLSGIAGYVLGRGSSKS